MGELTILGEDEATVVCELRLGRVPSPANQPYPFLVRAFNVGANSIIMRLSSRLHSQHSDRVFQCMQPPPVLREQQPWRQARQKRSAINADAAPRIALPTFAQPLPFSNGSSGQQAGVAFEQANNLLPLMPRRAKQLGVCACPLVVEVV